MKFKEEYEEWVINGSKTQTLRKHCDFIEGDVFELNNGYFKCSSRYKEYKFKIISIDKVAVNELRPSDAGREGFLSLPELVLALKEIYNDLEHSTLLYRIMFEKLCEKRANDV